jgi:GNAT superfamily N-acetyltransferase
MERVDRLGTQDAGEVLTLQRAAYVTEAQAHGDLDLPPLRQDLVALTAELGDPQGLALGCRDLNGRLVAAVRARRGSDSQGTWAEIGRLTVAPDRQGQGLGSGLLAALEDRLPVEITELRLFTGEHSHGNLRLYRRLGYIETSRQPTPAGYDLVHLHKQRRPVPPTDATR